MKRDISAALLKWKDSEDRMPLLLTGIRQCGKTYIMQEFGKTEFNGDYAYFNFEQNSALSDFFVYDLDPLRILDELRIVNGKPITPGKTLLIFDEIQTCVPAITSLKYFCEQIPELHVICAGSLLGVTLKEEQLSFPVGKVDRLQMYPMNFREFAEAVQPAAVELLNSRYVCGEPLSEAITIPFERLLKLYYIIGGMPKAVDTWIKTKDLQRVEKIQDNILQDYQNDFSKHAPKTDIPKLGMIWDSIPEQLAKENNKFVFSHVKKGKRSADLEDALEWLEEAGLAHKVKLVEDINLPLSYRASSTNFKLYMADVGLLRRKAGLSAETISLGGPRYIEFKGALAENYVLQQLLSLGKNPFFWRSSNQAEIDFLLEQDNQVIPLEVKADLNTKAKSMTTFCKRYDIQYGIKLSLKNIGDHITGNTKIYSIPLYLLWKLDDWLTLEKSTETFDFNKFADIDTLISEIKENQS